MKTALSRAAAIAVCLTAVPAGLFVVTRGAENGF